MSAEYAPVRDLDADETHTPGFSQPETHTQSTDDLPRASTSSPPGQFARAPADQSGNARAHIRPTFAHQRTGSTGQYADPWSPGYKRNVHRFSSSVGGVQELHAPPERAKRFSTASPMHRHSSSIATPPVGPPISKWQNFSQKFQGQRLRARGHKVPGWWASLKAIVMCSWLNVLFVFLPVAWVWGWKVAQPFVPYENKKKNEYADYVYLFILSFIAIIPLENIAEFAGEQLALYCGESIGDLIIITLHNVVEVVLAWFLLLKCELKLLQSTIIGVVLLHSLLVPGTAFLTGGSKIWAQTLKPRVTELNQSLLTIGVLALVVPAAFFTALPYQNPQIYAPQFANATLAASIAASANKTSYPAALVRRAVIGAEEHKALEHAMEIAAQVDSMSDKTRGLLLQLSRGISVILLVIYIASRIYLHNPPGGKQRTMTASHFEEGESVPMHDVGSAMTPAPSQYFDQKHPMSTPPLPYSSGPNPYSSTSNLIMREDDREKAMSMLENEHGDAHGQGGHHEHKPEIGPWPALILLLLSVAMVTVTAECLVIGIKPIREQADDKKLFTDEWFGLVLLPLLSYAGDGLNTTMFFIRSRLFSQNIDPPEDFAKAKAIDLAIQFTLFWIPALVLASWIAKTPLTLLFDHFEIVVVVGASFLVNSVTQDGRTNWAEGLIMVGFYTIIAVAAWFYPGNAESHFLNYCGSLQSLFKNPAEYAQN